MEPIELPDIQVEPAPEPRVFANLRAAGANNLAPPEVVQKAITDDDVDGYKEQERYLPLANVGRIMKKCLPGPTKVSKDAKECVQECTSEFISFITAEAAELCAGEKRKTINGEDILTAMTTLGFENYSDTLKIYLTKYRVLQRSTGKRGLKAEKKRQLEETAATETARILPESTSGGQGFRELDADLSQEPYDDSGSEDFDDFDDE